MTDIKNSLVKFIKNKRCHNLISVCSAKKNPYYNMIEKNKDEYKMVRKKKNIFRRQDAPEVFEINASIYIFKTPSCRTHAT